MSGKTYDVVFNIRVEDRDPKTGEKIVIPAGTEATLSEKEYEKVKHAVRVKPAKQAPEAPKKKAPAKKAAAKPAAAPAPGGDGDGTAGDEPGTEPAGSSGDDDA